jgi:hypothetical protein
MGGWTDCDLLGDLGKLAVAVNTAGAVKCDDTPKSNDSTALPQLTKTALIQQQRRIAADGATAPRKPSTEILNATS